MRRPGRLAFVVWRDWAQDSIDGVIDNQNSLRKEVTTAVARMMAVSFHPRRDRE